MNTAFPNSRNTRSLACTVMLSLAALVGCQQQQQQQEQQQPGLLAPAAEVALPAAAMPAPQAPFDTTPITPVESAGAAAT